MKIESNGEFVEINILKEVTALFNFEQHESYFSRPFRNTFTAWGRALATNFGIASGNGYFINYFGQALINQNKLYIPYR